MMKQASYFIGIDPASPGGDQSRAIIFRRGADGELIIVDIKRYDRRLNFWGHAMYWACAAIVAEIIVARLWGII